MLNPAHIPLSLYIHFPWCVKKCPYCDFNSHTLKDNLPENDYVDALINNLLSTQEYIQNRSLISIFMGGGTPSLFSAQAIDRLLNQLQKHLHWQNDIEITLEANPGTVEQQRFADYFRAGVNRISLGVQSLNPKHLAALGRIHSADEAKQAVETIKKSGFEHFNLDLMFGLPQQTMEEGLADLEQIIALEPTHISWYELTIEPNTLFWHHPPRLPEEEHIILLHQTGKKRLQEAGFNQYEVSAYARKASCRHNVNYWQFGDYLALGAGAHGKISHSDSSITRYHHFRNPKQFMQANQHSPKNFMQDCQNIDPKELPFEFMLNALRLTQGVPITLFEERTGLPVSVIGSHLQEARNKGWLEKDPTILKATVLGEQFLNDLVGLFLSLKSK